MPPEPRKATDIILDLEGKVATLLDLVRAQDFNIKVLLNRINEVVGRLDQQATAQPKFTAETTTSPPRPTTVPHGFSQIPAGDPERNIPFVAEESLPVETSPQGFRRSSRPETYVNKPQNTEIKLPVQIPSNSAPPGRGNGSEVIVVPPQATSNKRVATPPPVIEQNAIAVMPPQGAIPVMQRCVDKNSKAIFLADVEIVDMSNGQPFFKTRTTGNGKWMASLPIGNYRVTIHKRESVTKSELKSVQDVQIDGSQNKVELPMLIIK